MRFLASILIAVFFTSAAGAETVRRTVPANRTTGVGAQATYSAQCHPSAVPQMKVAQAPKHGKVIFKQVSFKLSESAGRCAGKRVKGMGVYYQPARGFRGKDEFRVRFTMNMYGHGSAKIRNIVDRYVIEVK